MLKQTIRIWSKGEYSFPVVGDFIPTLTTYLHEDGEIRPAVLIVPGGGYMMPAIGEAEPVANEFYHRGYQAFVLTYTTSCFLPVSLMKQPLKDLSRAVATVRRNAASWRVHPHQLALCGFSAGGHLCATLAVQYDDAELAEASLSPGDNRPDAVLLCYPVITAQGAACHRDSFRTLYGEAPDPDTQDYFSVERHVTPDTPPVFLWHTATDETVPVENTLCMERACREAKIPCEMHIFESGPHGYSVADEAWAAGDYGDDYVMDQFFAQMQYFIDNGQPLPAPFQSVQLPKGTDYRTVFRSQPKEYLKNTANPNVAIWTTLADNWLRTRFERQEVN